MSNVKIILVGDSAEGLKQAPLGMWYAKKMRSDGGKHGLVRSFVPAEGVLFKVLLDDYTGDKCYIEASTATCPLIQYSGYLDTDTPALNTDDPPILVMRGLRKVTSGVAAPYPSVPVKAQANYEDFALFLQNHKPTRYTGLMRKVLQCTFSTATWRDSLCFKTGTQYKFHLNYQWNDSWGVVLEPGKDGSKGEHYFLIQIVYNSVTWVKANFCVHVVKADEVDAFAPVLKSVDRAASTVIGTLPSLGGNSCSQPVGWSFSYTQPKASVVIYGDDGQTHVTVKLVTMDIHFANGKPASITQNIGTASVLWGPHDGATQGILHVPTQKPMAPEGVLINTTLTSIKQPWVTSNPTNYSVSNIPIHVYYLPGKDAPEIVGYSYREYAAKLGISTGITLENALTTGFGSSQPEAGYIIWGFIVSGGALPDIHGYRNRNWYVCSLADTRELSGSTYSETWWVTATGTSGYAATSQVHELSIVETTHTIETGGQGNMFSSCLLPVDDRECALICTSATIESLTTATKETLRTGGYNADMHRAGEAMRYVGLGGAISDTGIGTPPSMGALQDLWTANGWGTVQTIEFLYASGVPNIDGLVSISIAGSYLVSTTDNSNAGTSSITTTLYAKHDPISVGDWSYQLSKILFPEDNFAYRHSSGSFTPKKFYAYDKMPSQQVVVMGSEEYNPTNALTGWIGVV